VADALEEDHPNQAAEVREWNAATRRAMIAVLDQALKERHADRQTQLWRMTKGSREVTCARPCGARRRPGPTRTPGSAPGYRRWVCRRRCSSSSGATTATTVSGCPTLSGRAYNVKGAQKVDLTWTGFTGATLDVSRNGKAIFTTPNDGAQTDPINAKGGGSYTYTACATGPTSCAAVTVRL